MSKASAAQTAKTMRQLSQAAIPILIAVIALPLIGQIYLALFEPQPGANASALIATYIISAVPALILAFSLMGLAAMLREYEEGRFLSLTAGAAFKRVSAGAMIALIAHVAIAPILIGLIEGKGLGAMLQADTFLLCIMVFCAAMLTVGALLEDSARALKADNDQIV